MTEQVVGDANFGDVVHTNTVTQLFNVTNSGGVTATAVLEGVLAPPYTFAGGYPGGVGGSFCPAVTVPVGTCEIEVTFNPVATGSGRITYADTISITYNDGAAPAGPATLAITGDGIDRAALAITPNPHDY